MDNIILLLVLVIIVLAVVFSRKSELSGAEDRKEEEQTKKDSFAKEDVLSYGQVQDKRKELIDAVEASLKDNPEQVSILKQIINDWAELKIKSFQDRRSWVRNPVKESE